MNRRSMWDDFAEGFFVWGSLILCGWVGAQRYTLAAVGLLFLATIASIALRMRAATPPGAATVAKTVAEAATRTAALAEAAE